MMTVAGRHLSKFHLHLVSDATGETLGAVAKAALVQFEGSEPVEHLWTMIRTRSQVARVVEGVCENPGLVLFTMVDHQLREMLVEQCRQHRIVSVSVLDPVMHALATYLGAEAEERPGRQHVMDAEYFHRIDAMHFCIAHDDGHGVDRLREAEVILVGVSRTSKTPTCIYLGNRGIKAANVPVVPGLPFPELPDALEGPLVVGLTASAERLVQIRRHRLLSLNETSATEYADIAAVKEELVYARRLFTLHGWPVIDVTRRSIEETAAAVLNVLARRRAG